MKNYFKPFVFIALSTVVIAVQAQDMDTSENNKVLIDKNRILVEDVLSAEEQALLSPEDVLIESPSWK